MSAFELAAASTAIRDSHDRGGECGVGGFLALHGNVLVGVRLDCGHCKQLASLGNHLGFGSAGEQAVVADAMEALRQDMQQEATDELGHVERHGRVAAWRAQGLPMPRTVVTTLSVQMRLDLMETGRFLTVYSSAMTADPSRRGRFGGASAVLERHTAGGKLTLAAQKRGR
jgi:ribosomal protein S27AE